MFLETARAVSCRSIPKFLPLASSEEGENGAAAGGVVAANGAPYGKLEPAEKPVADAV